LCWPSPGVSPAKAQLDIIQRLLHSHLVRHDFFRQLSPCFLSSLQYFDVFGDKFASRLHDAVLVPHHATRHAVDQTSITRGKKRSTAWGHANSSAQLSDESASATQDLLLVPPVYQVSVCSLPTGGIHRIGTRQDSADPRVKFGPKLPTFPFFW
jgi:hypothetical protein